VHDSRGNYLPAAGSDWALPLYDPMVKLMGGEAARRKLLVQAALGRGHRILDIGCGTGTLLVLSKRLCPHIEAVGIDPDPKALARAVKKAARAHVSVQLDCGFADELPYPDASFDRVLSSFMFHHLEGDAREKALHEVRRVLKRDGSFHLADFARPEGQGHGLKHLFCASDHFKDNSDATILASFEKAGFANAKKTSEASMLFGLLRLAYFAASAPIQGHGGQGF
jgi:SAM-dependent methyltransferase